MTFGRRVAGFFALAFMAFFLVPAFFFVAILVLLVAVNGGKQLFSLPIVAQHSNVFFNSQSIYWYNLAAGKMRRPPSFTGVSGTADDARPAPARTGGDQDVTRRAKQKKPFFEHNPLRFECTRCGACCTGGADEHVFLAEAEARAIGRHLGLSWRAFVRRYLSRTADGERVARMTGEGRCVFLRADGGCGVYPVRPLQCRTYPFWPELVASGSAWRREARRCEGIERGARVPLGVIRAALAAEAEAAGEEG
jgi:Fe-S-cluster containining protein